MISVLPQTEHLHRNANGLTAETQLQLVAGCFIGSALLVGLGTLRGAVDHDKASVVVFNRPGWREAAAHCLRTNHHTIRTITIRIPI